MQIQGPRWKILSKFQHAPLRPWFWLFFVYRICLFLKSTSLNLQLIFLFPENSPPALPISWSLPFNIVASCSALSMHSTRSMAVAVVRRCLQLWTWRCMIGPSHWTVYWCVPFVRFVFRNSFVFFVLTIFLKLQLIPVILSDVPAVELSHFYCYGCAQMILSGVPAVELNHFYCYCWALLSSLIGCEIKCTVTSSMMRIRHERPVIMIDVTCCMPAITGFSYIICRCCPRDMLPCWHQMGMHPFKVRRFCIGITGREGQISLMCTFFLLRLSTLYIIANFVKFLVSKHACKRMFASL